MANTYSQVYVHVIFTVKGRMPLLRKEFREEVFKYMAGIARNKKNKVIIINGVEDHVHLLMSLRPNVALADIVRDIKNNSSAFVNERGWVQGVFQWQEGYGAFSCSPGHMENAKRYIELQEKHHRRRTFYDEYMKFMHEFEIEFDERYVVDQPGQKL